MTPGPLTKKQFVGWFVVFTIGMALWASPGGLLWGPGVGIVSFGNLILMTRQERSRSMGAREVLWIFVGLLVFVALMVASKWWLPDDFGASLEAVIRHPILVTLLWAAAGWVTYRRYKPRRTAQPTVA